MNYKLYALRFLSMVAGGGKVLFFTELPVSNRLGSFGGY